jgi:tRNA uridine 5-carbamoylmethylation protein Kti12
LLSRSTEDARPIIVMMCGIAGIFFTSAPLSPARLTHASGAGKSTLSKSIVQGFPRFIRLSIDQMIFDDHGLYGDDYPPSLYPRFQKEADEKFISEFRRLLSADNQPNDIVLDRSFYAKSDRESYRRMAEELGARIVLVFLDCSKDVLLSRIQKRAEGERNADSAFDMTENILDAYIDGFERPDGEGEVLIHAA